MKIQYFAWLAQIRHISMTLSLFEHHRRLYIVRTSVTMGCCKVWTNWTPQPCSYFSEFTVEYKMYYNIIAKYLLKAKIKLMASLFMAHSYVIKVLLQDFTYLLIFRPLCLLILIKFLHSNCNCHFNQKLLMQLLWNCWVILLLGK